VRKTSILSWAAILKLYQKNNLKRYRKNEPKEVISPMVRIILFENLHTTAVS
jgi:hypothetical protein